MRSLESRDYVATDLDIKHLTEQVLDAVRTSRSVRVTYLRALIATAQSELHKTRYATEHERVDHQRDTVERVHARFYEVVLQTIGASPDVQDSSRLLPKERHRRALERNRRSNFARSAKTTLLGWLRVDGHDLRELVAAKVTKAALTIAPAPGREKPLRPGLVRRQAVAAADKFIRLLTRKLIKADEAAARELFHQTMVKLSHFAVALGDKPTKKQQVAIDEHRPWETSTGVFLPLPVSRKKRSRAA